MRFVHVRVADADRAAVCDRLREEGVDYVETADAGDEAATIVHFPLPTEAVDEVLGALREAGVDDSFVVVGNAESALTPGFDDLEARFVGAGEGDEGVASEEIRATARNLLPGPRTYYAMTVLSVVVATAGLLLDAPAVVVGSMVIAPQVGSALTASVGVALDDRGMVVDGLRTQVVGLTVAVAVAVAFGFGLKWVGVIPAALDVTTVTQIGNRTSPGVLSVLVGLCAGAAGAFGVATDLPVSLVGVAVAAALVPAAAAVGVGVAWGYPAVATGAFVLLVINVVSINLAGALVLWYLGYRPDDWSSPGLRANLGRDRLATTALVVGSVLLVTLLVGTVVAGQATFETDATAAVSEVLSEPEYEAVRLVGVRSAFSVDPFDDRRSVTVAVQTPVGRRYPDLAPTIRARIAAATGADVSVTVEETPVAHAGEATAGASGSVGKPPATVAEGSHLPAYRNVRPA